MPNFDLAPMGSKIFGKLPVNHDYAARMIDLFIAPMLERAGMTVKVTKTKNTRTLRIQLPTK